MFWSRARFPKAAVTPRSDARLYIHIFFCIRFISPMFALNKAEQTEGTNEGRDVSQSVLTGIAVCLALM